MSRLDLHQIAVVCICNLTDLKVNKILVFGGDVVLDTAAGVWCDRKGVVNSPRIGRYSNDAAGGEAANELTRRCRHAAAAVGDHIFMYGGLRGGMCYAVH